MVISDRDLVQFSRLALSAKPDDVAMFVRRLARKIRERSPKTSEALVRLAKEYMNGHPTRASSLPQLPVDLESRLELAKIEHQVPITADPIWTPDISAAFDQVVTERMNEEALAQAHLSPARSLLFVGPPGVGKTLSARWLARRLNMPLVTLDLAAVMSSFLGRTGNNLRNVLDYAKGVGCILLLDEFDAIAKRRDDAVEVGELKRLVTVLLQEIDQWPACGILIAATNHSELLDPAVWRRFDIVIEFGFPSEDNIRRAITQLLASDTAELHKALAIVLRGQSYSDIERELLRAKRRAVVNDVSLTDILEGLISERVSNLRASERKQVALALTSSGYSQRRTQKLTGVSRDTIRNSDALPGEPETD